MADPIYSNKGVLSVETEEESAVPIAGIRDVTITPTWETAELYTMDSGFREAVAQFEHNVNVEISYAKFDIDAAKEWLGGAGASATGTQDTNDPQLFTIEYVSDSHNSDFERTVEAEKVVFPEFPLVQATQDEFEEWDLSGSGRSISNFDDTSPE